MSKKDSKAQTFSCQNCGHAYTVNPPDSSYLYAYIRPCQDNQGDPEHNYKQFYECDNCNHRNELYWCSGHVFVSSSGNIN